MTRSDPGECRGQGRKGEERRGREEGRAEESGHGRGVCRGKVFEVRQRQGRGKESQGKVVREGRM